MQSVVPNGNFSRSHNVGLLKHSPGVASSRCWVLVGAASTAAVAEAICFELLRCREEQATRLQDPMQPEASLSPPSYSGAALHSDPGLGAGPTVFAPPAEGASAPEDNAQPCADLQMETMPCAEELRTPIASSCVAAEEAASHERRLKTFAEEVRCPIRSPLAQRPVKTRKDPFPPPHGHPGLPKRSERLANHSLASVPSSKRAEVMLMRRFNVVPEVAAPNSDSKKAYSELYKEKFDDDHLKAVRDLLPALRNSSIMGFTLE